MFKNPTAVIEATRGRVNFEFNTSNSRSKSTVINEAGVVVKNKYYSGISTVEVLEKPNKTLQFITYLAGSPYDAQVALEKTYTVSGTSYTPSTQEYLYLHRDYQGTILAISGNGGVVKERRQFDPWGVLKKQYKGTLETPTATLGAVDFELLTDRGYTGHEHFFSVGIIHMNGRIYDPVLRTFLSPDPVIQDLSNSQNYNRYAYCVNNPLLYTDYSGAIFGIDDVIVSAIIIGAIIGGMSYAGMALYTGTFTWEGLGKSILVGAVSGAATSGIGTIAQSIKVGTDAMSIGSQLLRHGVSALMHGMAQGFIQGVSGGNFEQNFLTAAISSISSGGYGMISGSFGGSDVGQVLFGTVAGGVTARLQGGNIWEGAVMGFTISLLNDVAHKVEERESFFNRLRVHYESKTGEDFKLSAREFKYLIRKGEIDYNHFTKVGDNRYEAIINFYDSDKDLALSFGRATVSYTVENGKKVFDSFHDRYDFDSKEWGKRSVTYELLTRAYNTISGGKSFNINYNYNYAKSYNIHYNLDVVDNK